MALVGILDCNALRQSVSNMGIVGRTRHAQASRPGSTLCQVPPSRGPHYVKLERRLSHTVLRCHTCGPASLGPPLCQAGFLPMDAIGKTDARIMSSWGRNVMSTSMLSERSGVDSDGAIPYMALRPMMTPSPRISEIATVYVLGR